MGEFLRFAARVGVSLERAVTTFYRARPGWWSSELETKQLALEWLRDQRRQVPLVQISRATGYSRFALRRWFSGEAEPRLHEYLAVLDACSRRIVDFLAAFTDPEQLPSARDAYLVQTLARQAAYERPWSHAVMRALETADYQALPEHEPGWIARRLGITDEEEEQCLELLRRSRQVQRKARRYHPATQEALDLRAGHAAARALSAWWVSVAAERAKEAPGMFAYNVCGLSRRDLDRIQALQIDYMKQVRAIVAESNPVETVALVATQVFALDEETRGGDGAPHAATR